MFERTGWADLHSNPMFERIAGAAVRSNTMFERTGWARASEVGLSSLMDAAPGCADCKVRDPRSAALMKRPSPAPWPVAESPRNVALLSAYVPTAGFFNTAAAELAAPRLPVGFALVEAADVRPATGALLLEGLRRAGW